MGVTSWIFMGLIVGVLAKWIMPGEDPGGIFVTILIGIAGAFLGGFIGSFIGLGSVSGFDLISLGLAVGGALLLLYVYRLLKQSI
ncbi:MAG: GlsB/YeaQ/YmgE family stress response membrane protein [Gammaproteobacteria bacterium]|nr:GlsB/YeaQ/YmgE family stress response membrane protein [Gammaproteobacteria bacterium]